jgi:hypothetical protein
MADDMIAELGRGTSIVIINEITRPGSPGGDSRQFIHTAIDRIGFGLPARWGVYIMPGESVDYFNDIEVPEPSYLLAYIIIRGGWIFPEIYISVSQYGSGGDAYVLKMIEGGYPVAAQRTTWLENYRVVWRDAGGGYALYSRIVPVMGVSDTWLGSAGGTSSQPAKLLDRIWFVGATQATHPGLWNGAAGISSGPGSYLWNDTGLYVVSPIDRDEVFGASHRWYVQGRNQNSRLGAV